MAAPPVAALRNLLQELQIGSLDTSDLEAGLEELSSEELGSRASVGLGSDLSAEAEDDVDSSSDSGVFAQAYADLAGTNDRYADDSGAIQLEEMLRLQTPGVPSGLARLGTFPGGLPGSQAFQQLQQIQQMQHLQQLQTTVEAMQHAQQAQQTQAATGTVKPAERPEQLLQATSRASSNFRLQMNDLSISEGCYQVLRKQPDEELTVREWVQMRFYEAQSILRAESERLRREVEALRETHLAAQTRAERAERQLALRGASMLDLTQELQQLQGQSRSQLEQVTADLRSSEQKLAEGKDKERRFDDVMAESNRLREEVRALRDALDLSTAAQQRRGKEHIEASERVLQLDADVRLARQDAQSHERRALLLEDSLARRDEEAAELRSKVEGLREKKRELARKAALEQVGTVNEVRDQVTAEINRFQQQAQSDLEAVRTNLSALHEREIRMYQERLQSSELKVGELQRRLEDEEQGHQALQLSAGRVRAELQNEITELTGMLKLRAFEVERASLTHEEVSLARQRLEVESDQLKRQVEVLRKEFYNLELQHREGRATERAELASLREQLRGYVELEKELDAAIRACAEGASAAEGKSVTEALLIGTTLASAPASAQRRIQQSLLLAQELQRRTREACEARAALAQARATSKGLAEELEVAQREAKAAAGSSPQAYLLDALRKAEAEALRLRRELSSQTGELERSRELAASAQAARIRAEEDLRQLLAQRQNLAGLKALFSADASAGAGTQAGNNGGDNEGLVLRHRGRAPNQMPHHRIAGAEATTTLSEGLAGLAGTVGASGRIEGGAGTAATAGPAWFQKLRSQISERSEHGTETIKVYGGFKAQGRQSQGRSLTWIS